MLAPSEDFETKRLVAWLDARGYVFSHIANETFSQAQGIRNKRMGVRPGVPDFFVCIKRGALLWIELKRQSGGKVSKPQEAMLIALRLAGCQVRVCKGFAEAVRAVEECEANGTT